MQRDTVGEMSCNPAIGGLGKGHLVRELTPWTGSWAAPSTVQVSSFACSTVRAGLLFMATCPGRPQTLSSGHPTAAEEQDGITLIEAAVGDLIVKDGCLAGLVAEDGRSWHAPAAVLTTGTFLGGIIHLGEDRQQAGRFGEAPSNHLARDCVILLLACPWRGSRPAHRHGSMAGQSTGNTGNATCR